MPSKATTIFSCQNCGDQICAWLSDCALGLQIVGAFEKDGQKLPHNLTGKWDTSLEATMPDGTKQRIWTIHPMPAETTRYTANPAFLCPGVPASMLSIAQHHHNHLPHRS